MVEKCDCAELSTRRRSQSTPQESLLVRLWWRSAIVRNSVPQAIAKRSAGIAFTVEKYYLTPQVKLLEFLNLKIQTHHELQSHLPLIS